MMKKQLCLTICSIKPTLGKNILNFLEVLFGITVSINVLTVEKKVSRGKGILDRDRNPTDLAYQILPSRILRKILKELREKAKRIEARRDELETKCRDLQKIEKYKLISEIADKFSFLGVDENWVAVLISTNLVEQAMKKKLEELGIPLKAEKGQVLEMLYKF